MATLSRKSRAATEIDIRVHDLIMRYLESDEFTTAETLGFFRAAYVQGYTDCLKEDPSERGKWIKDLGYGVNGVSI